MVLPSFASLHLRFCPAGRTNAAAARCAIVLAVAAALPTRTLHAQPPAGDGIVTPSCERPRLLLGLGGGGHLQAPGVGNDKAMSVAAVGVRVPVWRAIVGEGLLQLHAPSPLPTGNDASYPCGQPRSGSGAQCLNRFVDSRLRDVQLFAGALARVGVEQALVRNRVHVRATAGGGWMGDARRPFASLAGGLSLGGRGTRLTADVDHWRYRVPGIEEETSSFPPSRRVVAVSGLSATSTWVRLGVALPLRGGR